MSENISRKLVIFDGNAIVHRAYHAVPPLTTKDGMLVNAVYGFASMLLKVWRDLKPTHIAVTFDMAGGTFRHQEFKEYKATRVKADQALYDQVPLVHDLVAAFGISIYEKKGYEADDVIGTIVEQASGQFQVGKDEVFVVTGDMDSIQLVRPGVKVYTLRKGMADVVVYDEVAAFERYGFVPDRLIDYKGLAGDKSDNIPGVPGIGEKSATDLIKQYGSLEQIYEAVETKGEAGFKPAVYRKLVAGKEMGILSKRLATIDRQVPDLDFSLERAEIKAFDKEVITSLFQKLEFMSLLKRLPELADGKEVAKPATAISTKKTTTSFNEVHSSSDVSKIITTIVKIKSYVAVPIFNNGDSMTGGLIGVLFLIDRAAWFCAESFFSECRALFEDEKVELVGHDLKEVVKICGRYGMSVKNQLFDVMMGSYLLQSGSRAHSLSDIALKILGKELVVSENQTSLFGVDPRSKVEELLVI
jgi:DNA polymerase I